MIKKPFQLFTQKRTVLAAVMALSVPSAFATTVATSYNDGDIFIGFRQQTVIDGSPAANDLVANIGPFTRYIPVSLGVSYGGTWNGNPLTVSFGVVPGTSTPVTSLATDLSATFGTSWATNDNLGDGVHWGVIGLKSAAGNYSGNTVLITKAETAPGTKSATPAVSTGNSGNGTFTSNLGAFINNGYLLTDSTANSSVAISESASAQASWNKSIGTQGSAFGSGVNIEQATSGPFSGPTNSVLDLYLKPGAGSGVTTSVQYLGSFGLDSNGQLTYAPSSYFAAVPEPGSIVLLALGLTFFVYRFRNRFSKAKSLD